MFVIYLVNIYRLGGNELIMKSEEIRKCPQKNGYYIIYSGTSKYNGVVLSWQAIPVEDVCDGYHYMEGIVVGKEEKTEKRQDYLAVFLFYIGLENYGRNKVARWHAAEHKIINLLIENMPLTLEEAKKISSVVTLCGNNNKILADPTDTQLLEVLEAGKKIRKQVEDFLSFSFFEPIKFWWIQRRIYRHRSRQEIKAL